MTEETFRAALDMEPVRGRGCFSFGTGEPTVHPRFWDFVDLALTDGRWRIRIVTNGKRKETALRLARMASEGVLEAHLSLDEWHDPIDPTVVEAFRRDPSNHLDRRAYRTCPPEDLKNVGRCDFGPARAPTCRCPVPRVTVDGSIFWCGCESAIPIGHVSTGWDRSLVSRPRVLGCVAFSPEGDVGGIRAFHGGMGRVLRRGADRPIELAARRASATRSIEKLRACLVDLGELEIHGSYSRGSTSPRDIDALLIRENGGIDDLPDALVQAGASNVRSMKHGVRFTIDRVLVELWVTDPTMAGSARLYLEGPASRNAALRKKALEKSMVWKFDGIRSSTGELLTKNLSKERVREMLEKA